jgi:hypothetical protein
MTDFIARLAARTLGMIPVVQPIIAPIYAQRTPLIGNASANLDVEEYQEGEARGQSSTRLTRQISPQLDSVSARAVQPSALNAPIPPQTYKNTAGMLSSPSPVITSPAEILPEVESLSVRSAKIVAAHVPTKQADTTTTSQRSTPQIAQTIIENVSTSSEADRVASLVEQRQFSGSQPVHPMMPTRDPELAGSSSTPWIEGTDSRPVELGRRPGGMSFSQPATQPHIITRPEHRGLSLENQPLSKPAEVSSTPTIQVTIGRIEVRATSSSTRPRPQPQRSDRPVMSLDEYLNSRGGGGR